MRPSTLSLLLLGCLLTTGCERSRRDASKSQPEADRAAFEAIKACRGKDLADLPKAQVKELQEAISRFVPKRSHREFDLYPRHVWEFQRKEERPVYLLFEEDKTQGGKPGCTVIRITLFDDFGKVLSITRFGTGWRCYLRRVTLEDSSGGEYPLIVLETESELGPDVKRQCYASIGDRFDLVRLENPHGKATRNEYYVRHFACGPLTPKRTEAEWESDLLSGGRLEMLRVLVWIGGTHYDLKPGIEPSNQDEDPQDVLLLRKVRENKKVIARLKELADSDDQWIREAAQLCLSPNDKRFGD